MSSPPIKKRTKRKPRDPDVPRKPQSAYMFFSAEQREKLKDQKIKPTELMKQIAGEWQLLDEKSKEKYEEMHQLAKIKYAEQKKEYDEKVANRTPKTSEGENSEGESKTMKKKRRKKEEGGPKRPTSAWIHFCSDNRAAAIKSIKDEDPNARPPIGDVTKQLSKIWNTMEEKDKLKYREMAGEDKARYGKEKVEFIEDQEKRLKESKKNLKHKKKTTEKHNTKKIVKKSIKPKLKKIPNEKESSDESEDSDKEKKKPKREKKKVRKIEQSSEDSTDSSDEEALSPSSGSEDSDSSSEENSLTSSSSEEEPEKENKKRIKNKQHKKKEGKK